VGGGFLHVAQRRAGAGCGGDERVPQGVRSGGLGDPGAAGNPADGPPGAVPVQSPAAQGEKDGSFAALADGQVDCPRGARGERDRDDLAARAGDRQGPVAPPGAQVLDAGAGGFGDPQPVAGRQRDQRVPGGRAGPGGDQQQRAGLVAVRPGGVRLVVQPGPAGVGGRGVTGRFFLGGVAAEPGDGAQPAGDGGPAAGFQVTGEAFDIRAAGTGGT
jgi:hypothetical protein